MSESKEDNGSTFYFIQHDGTVGCFVPALQVRRSTNPYFGGWEMMTPDLRSLEELKKSGQVRGLVLREGGNGLEDIHGSCLFATPEEALSMESK